LFGFTKDIKMLKILGTFLVVTLVPLRGLCDSLVSPTGEANIQLASPFLIQRSEASSYRFQEVHAATAFAGVSSPIAITEISYRRGGATVPVDVVLDNISIRLSTTTATPDHLNGLYSANIGLDETVVYSGGLHFFENGTDPFGLHVVFQHPFVFDPSKGNLLMDFYNGSPVPPLQSGFYGVDAISTFGDSVSILAGSGNSPFENFSTAGMITRFEYTPVPEPNEFIFVALAGVVSCWFRRRFRRGFGANEFDKNEMNRS
jgi:hypothetical protein